MSEDGMPEWCYFLPGNGQKSILIDVVTMDENGVAHGVYGKETLEETQARRPGAVLMKFDEAVQAMRAEWIVKPVRVPQEYWQQMLEMLPPKNWINRGETESWMLIEHAYADITACFVRIGGDYYQLQDSAFTTHADLVKKCRDAFPTNGKEENPKDVNESAGGSGQGAADADDGSRGVEDRAGEEETGG